MKVHHMMATYTVFIALGKDINNQVWEHTFLGKPTQEKVMAYFDHVTKELHGYICASGLPGGETLAIFHQCQYLVETFGLPKTGLGKECVTPVYGNILGHIWIDKAPFSITHVE